MTPEDIAKHYTEWTKEIKKRPQLLPSKQQIDILPIRDVIPAEYRPDPTVFVLQDGQKESWTEDLDARWVKVVKEYTRKGRNLPWEDEDDDARKARAARLAEQNHSLERCKGPNVARFALLIGLNHFNLQ